VAEGRASAIAPVWLARGLAAAAAAGTAGWLSGELLAPAPLAPAAACLLAGGLTLLLPRVGWLALAGAACGTAISQGRPGGAIVVAIAMLVPILLLVRRPTAWPLAVAAPALGLIGLAGAWPALAGQAATPWRRAALGASGWVILLLATPIAGRTLYLPGWVDGSVGTRPPGTPRASGWISSPDQTLHQVLGPLVSSGVLVPALIWALGASILPWLTGGRWFALDLVRVVVWAAVLVSATGIAVTAVHAGHGLRTAPSATLGALAAAAMALAPSGLAAWRDRARATEPEAGFP
jgi:hypothetical protein